MVPFVLKGNINGIFLTRVFIRVQSIFIPKACAIKRVFTRILTIFRSHCPKVRSLDIYAEETKSNHVYGLAY